MQPGLSGPFYQMETGIRPKVRQVKSCRIWHKFKYLACHDYVSINHEGISVSFSYD